jgi:hypothetical protein
MAGKKKGSYSTGSGTTVTIELDLMCAETLLTALNTAIYGGGGKKKKKKGKKGKGKGKGKGKPKGSTSGKGKKK